MPRVFKTYDNGQYSLLLSLLSKELGVFKERPTAEGVPVKGALVEGVHFEATPKSPPRSVDSDPEESSNNNLLLCATLYNVVILFCTIFMFDEFIVTIPLLQLLVLFMF